MISNSPGFFVIAELRGLPASGPLRGTAGQVRFSEPETGTGHVLCKRSARKLRNPFLPQPVGAHAAGESPPRASIKNRKSTVEKPFGVRPFPLKSGKGARP